MAPAGTARLWLEALRSVDGDEAAVAVDVGVVAGADDLGRDLGADDGGDAEIAGDDAGVADQAAEVGDHRALAEEEWGPTCVGGVGDEDVTLLGGEEGIIDDDGAASAASR